MGVDLKVLDMPVDAQDVANGGQLVGSAYSRSGGYRAWQHQPTDEAEA